MPGVMDNITGGVNPHVQPQDNPNPSTPTPDISTQNLQGLPTPRPAPQGAAAMGATMGAQIAPQSADASTPQSPDVNQAPPSASDASKAQDDKSVDDLIADLSSQPQGKKAKAEKHDNEIDGLISQLGGQSGTPDPTTPIIDKKKGESSWDSAMRHLSEGSRFIAVKMRAALGRNPEEIKNAFESMYGGDNVKTVGKDLYFRPDGGDKFRKADQTLISGIVDPLIFNALRAKDIAAGAVAQGVTQIPAMTAMGPVAGSAAAGAVGGLASEMSRQWSMRSIDFISSLTGGKPQNTGIVNDLKADLSATGFGALAGIAGMYAGKAIGAVAGPAKQAIQKIASVLPGGEDFLSSETTSGGSQLAQKAMSKASDYVQKLAVVRVGMEQFVNTFYPEAENTTAQVTRDAVSKAFGSLGKAVGVIKEEAISLADAQSKVVPMEGTLKYIGDTLRSNGYKISDMGTIESPEDSSAMSPPMKAGYDKLKDIYNSLYKDKITQSGSELRSVFNSIQQVDSNAWGPGVDKKVGPIFGSVRNAMTIDRNSFLTELYKASDSASVPVWEQALGKFHDNIGAIKQFQLMFKKPESIELMFDTLTKTAPVKRQELLNGVKNVLGEESPEWKGLQGQMIDSIVNKHIDPSTGLLKVGELLNYVRPKTEAEVARGLVTKNDPMMNSLMDKQSRAIFNKMLVESKAIMNGGPIKEGGGFEKGVSELASRFTTPGKFVKLLFSLNGGSVKGMNQLADGTLLDAARTVEETGVRDRLLEAQRITDGLISKMKIIDVPTTLQNGKRIMVQRYAPIATQAISKGLQSLASPMLNSDSGGEPPPPQGNEAVSQ